MKLETGNHARRLTRSALVALAMGCLVAGQAWGGWSTNWPSQEHPRSLEAQIVDCYSGIVERCTVAGVALPSTNTIAGWRDARADLVDLKAKVKALVPYFVVVSQADEDGTFTTWFGTGASDFPMWTVTGLCAALSLPTNYFEYTPYRALTGNGWDTTYMNGTTWPHGDTNATTLAGGDGFPAMRDRWFTTDYGVVGLPDVVNALVWTKRVGQISFVNKHRGSSSILTTWAATKTAAETAYSQTEIGKWCGVGNLGSKSSAGSYFLATLTGGRFYGSVSSVATGLWHSAQFYYHSRTMTGLFGDPEWDDEPSGGSYTNWGTGLMEDQYAIVTEELTEAATNARTDTTWGVTNMMNNPWVNEPVYADRIPSFYANGFFPLEQPPIVILKWDGANGFQYVKE